VGKVFDGIDAHQRAWIERQAMFFVGSAPLSADGHVNISPKGPIGSLAVLDERTVAYLDVVGSGIETIAHLRENGRVVVMFCAFEGPPRIVRLHGRGEVVLPGSSRFDELIEQFEFENLSIDEARRAIIVVDVTRVSDSCGYGVPLMTYEGQRPHHAATSAKRLRSDGEEAYRARHRARGAESLDGLPALDQDGR
jgi:hypothetical protein